MLAGHVDNLLGRLVAGIIMAGTDFCEGIRYGAHVLNCEGVD